MRKKINDHIIPFLMACIFIYSIIITVLYLDQNNYYRHKYEYAKQETQAIVKKYNELDYQYKLLYNSWETIIKLANIEGLFPIDEENIGDL